MIKYDYSRLCFCVCTPIRPTEVNFKLVIMTYLKRLKRRCFIKDIDNLSKELFKKYKHLDIVDPSTICKYIFKLPRID